MVRLSQIFKDYAESGALHAQLALWGFVGDEGVFLTKAGDVGLVLQVDGVDYECRDPDELDAITRRFDAALRVFDERFRIYQYLLKRTHAPVPHEAYPEHPVVQRAITSRLDYLGAKAAHLYTLDIYVVVLFHGWRPGGRLAARLRAVAAHPWATLAQWLSGTKTVQLIDTEIAQAEDVLATHVERFVVQLSDLCAARRVPKAEAFGFFRRLLNYTPATAAAATLHETHLDYFVADETLDCHRDHLVLGDHAVKVLTLKEPPAQTVANLTQALQDLPSNVILCSEWGRTTNAATRRRIHRARRHHHAATVSIVSQALQDDRHSPAPDELLRDDAAQALVRDLGGALTAIEVEGQHVGLFSFTVVLYDRDLGQLRRSAAEAQKVFAAHDGALLDERYNLLNAWLAVVPGNYEHNLRALYLLTRNYADLSFFFTLHTGEPRNAHLDAEYLAVFETAHETPYFFNVHHEDIAHTLILGATGSGKSFLLNFLLTNVQKYAPVTMIFDLGGSYEHVTELFGGRYVPMGLEQPRFTINPFSVPLTAEHRQFLFQFVSVLATSSGYTLTTTDARDLYAQIASVYALDPEQRRLFTLANIVNRSLRQPLEKWIEGGQYGRVFDNVEDTLTLATFQCFEFEAMRQYPELLEPLLFYVLHRASTALHDPALATTFKVFVIDEAWRFLQHPTITRYIVEALKTWRKHNAALILATQSLADLDHDDTLAVIAESCPTKLFLSNPGMARETYRRLFQLNETEAEAVAALIPKRQLLLKRPQLAKVLTLTVDDTSYWLYTNSPFDNARRRAAFEAHGVEGGLAHLVATTTAQGAVTL